MYPRLFPSILPFITILILFLIHFPPPFCAADNEYYQSCSKSYKCGDLSITYPFWGTDRPQFCGYDGFEVNCTSDVLRINISTIIYRILSIDTTSTALIVARDDYYGSYCPQYLHNSTIDFDIFSYSSNYPNLTLYYDCITEALSNVPYHFSCNTNDTDISGYYMTPAAITNVTTSWMCDDLVTVPVSQSAIQKIERNATEENLVSALKGGFGLQWAANNSYCGVCTQSGGQCGRNLTTDAFICYCSDGSYPSMCGSSSRSSPENNSNKTPLAAGLAIAGVAVIGVGFLCFYVRKRKKQRVAQLNSKDLSTPPSSKSLPTPATDFYQTTPSYPSSKSFDVEKGSCYFGAQVFSYAELEEATENFDPSRELGEGGFGTVYFGKLRDGREVAVKRLYENNFKRIEQFMNEVEILTRLRHPNLVALYGCTSRRSRELLLVYEYIANGTVADHLHGKKANSGLLTWPVRLSIAVETAEALAYLHKSDIIHRDVKTPNILLDKDFQVKVADFGLSRLFPTDCTHVSTAPQGTPGYVDPEYYQCYQLTDKSDVYSFGVVLVELISSMQAVDTSRSRLDVNLANMAVTKIQSESLHELVDPRLGFETDSAVRRMITLAAELAFRCLQQERDMRPSMGEVVEALKAIGNGGVNAQKAEVMDISPLDDAGLLKNVPLEFSPDSVVNNTWVSYSTAPNSI